MNGGDVGFTHIAFVVEDLDASLDFYQRYCSMCPVHERQDGDVRVRWISDLTRPFVVVLIEGDRANEAALGPFGHLGIACASRERVDELAQSARAEGRLTAGPTDSGPPVGYWALLEDPDGNTVELSYGQEVGLAVSAERDT